jgi:hypothetical protein
MPWLPSCQNILFILLLSFMNENKKPLVDEEKIQPGLDKRSRGNVLAIKPNLPGAGFDHPAI